MDVMRSVLGMVVLLTIAFLLSVNKKKISLKEPIKSLGTHIVTVKLHPEVAAELKVSVKEEA